MDKESPNRRLLDIKFEITQCRGELAGLSQIIDEVEGELGRVGHTQSLILRRVPGLTRSNSPTTSLTKMMHHQTGDPISSPRTTIKPSPTITN